jgi:CRISPR-associated protein Cas2
MRTLITFDVTSDKSRAQIAKLLRAHAVRVQKSVFEATDLPDVVFLRLRGKLEALIDPSTDSIRYYRLCLPCGARIDHYGAGPGKLAADDGFVVIGGTSGAGSSDATKS